LHWPGVDGEQLWPLPPLGVADATRAIDIG
jgi:hypothetical protein